MADIATAGAGAELRKAHDIIRIALNCLSGDQRKEFFHKVVAAGLDGEGITRANGRETVLQQESVQLDFARAFIAEFEENEDDEYSQAWRDLAEKARAIIAGQPEPLKSQPTVWISAQHADALQRLASEGRASLRVTCYAAQRRGRETPVFLTNVPTQQSGTAAVEGGDV